MARTWGVLTDGSLADGAAPVKTAGGLLRLPYPRFPRMLWPMTDRADLLRRISETVADLYDDQANARRLARSAGLSLARINLTGAPVVFWLEIVVEAERQGKIEALLESASMEYPVHTELANLRAEYRTLLAAQKQLQSAAREPESAQPALARDMASPDRWCLWLTAIPGIVVFVVLLILATRLHWFRTSAPTPTAPRPALAEATQTSEGQAAPPAMASTKPAAANASSEPFEFVDKVEDISEAFWTIGPFSVRVTGDTQFIGNPGVGDVVEVDGQRRGDGVWAQHIALRERLVQFAGTIMAMKADGWLIDEQRVIVDGATQLSSELHVGTPVVVRALEQPDGSLVARIIALDSAPNVPTATPSPTDVTTPQAGATAAGPNEMVLVYVPAGPFTMGSRDDNPSTWDDERPQHEVEVEGFWISRTEVTNAQYIRCVMLGICPAPQNDEYNRPEFTDRPVTDVNWYDANAYARWVGGRLPTEAEWEKACRGTDGRIYPWGNFAPAPELLNYDGKIGRVTDVGSYPPGTYGLFDMAGNAWEWTASRVYMYPYRADDGRNDLEAEGIRGVRGGSWSLRWNYIRCAYRDGRDSDVFSDQIGFRVIVPLPASGF
jgi:formylglycine-generating enzyme required for sulfatase activity